MIRPAVAQRVWRGKRASAAACLNIVGRINKVGVDLGWEKGGTLIWDVRSPALASGALSGNYIGASADVVAGVSAGANALVGGNKMVLNPISVSGDIGINLAAPSPISISTMPARGRQSRRRAGASPTLAALPPFACLL